MQKILEIRRFDGIVYFYLACRLIAPDTERIDISFASLPELVRLRRDTKACQHSRRAAALASVLFLMVILFAFSLSYFALMRMSCQYAVHAERQARAWSAARSGIEWFYSRAKLVEASEPGYTLPGVGVTTTLSLGSEDSCEVVQISGPPTNACVAKGIVKNSGGVVYVTRRLALPTTTGDVMELLYDPDGF